MKTKDVIKLFGTQAKVAQFLGITQPAVAVWGEDVPELRMYQLRERMPAIEMLILQQRHSQELQAKKADRVPRKLRKAS